jgi:hypothetical protein
MSITDLSSSAGTYFGGNSIDTMSGASSYVPPNASTTATAFSEMRNQIKQNSQDFKSLKTALAGNDLAGATQAFATLQSDIQNVSTAAGGKSPFDSSSPIGKDFAAIGDALKTGDLASAQKAFATFRQDIKSASHTARTHHHHAHAANSGQASNATPAVADTAAVTGTGSILNASA